MYDIFTYISHKNPPFMDRQIYKSSHGSFGISCEENNPTSSNRIRWAEDVMLPIVGQIFIAVRCLYMTRLGEFFSPRLKIPVEIWESCIDKNSWSFLLVSKNLTLDVKHEFQNKSQCFPATSSPLPCHPSTCGLFPLWIRSQCHHTWPSGTNALSNEVEGIAQPRVAPRGNSVSKGVIWKMLDTSLLYPYWVISLLGVAKIPAKLHRCN